MPYYYFDDQLAAKNELKVKTQEDSYLYFSSAFLIRAHKIFYKLQEHDPA